MSGAPLNSLKESSRAFPRIRVTAPSRQMIRADGSIDEARRATCLANLKELLPDGDVRLPEATRGNVARFAGTDEARLRDFTEAMTDADTDLVLALRGGYGASRLLREIDWKVLERSRAPFMGYSDATALQIALYTKTRRPSWHGPTFSSFDRPSVLTVEGFLKATATLEGKEKGKEFEVGFSARIAGKSRVSAERTALEGLLWGGNLAMTTALVGTPWLDPEAFRGGILFLEEVGESAYRIERMLLTLRDAGILETQRAILFGTITGADRAVAFPGDFRLADALDFITSDPTMPPVLTGFPMGHGSDKHALPVGCRVRLELEAEEKNEAREAGERRALLRAPEVPGRI